MLLEPELFLQLMHQIHVMLYKSIPSMRLNIYVFVSCFSDSKLNYASNLLSQWRGQFIWVSQLRQFSELLKIRSPCYICLDFHDLMNVFTTNKLGCCYRLSKIVGVNFQILCIRKLLKICQGLLHCWLFNSASGFGLILYANGLSLYQMADSGVQAYTLSHMIMYPHTAEKVSS